MKLFTYGTFGDLSEEVETVVDRVLYFDVTDPLVPVQEEIDWSDEGYSSDGEELDGAPDVDGNDTRPSLRFYQYSTQDGAAAPAFATVYIDGVATTANGIPFRFSSVRPGAAIFRRNVPRDKGVLWECAIVFKKPNGRKPVVVKYQQAVE